MTKWQNYDTILYRIPQNSNFKKTLYVFNFFDLMNLTSLIPTRSLNISQDITENIKFKYKNYKIDQLVLNLPVTKCVLDPENTVNDCRQLDIQTWVWKSETIPDQLKSLVDTGANVLIYFNPPPTTSLNLSQTYDACNIFNQVIYDLKFDIYFIISTNNSSMEKILKTLQLVSRVNFINPIFNFVLSPQPNPSYSPTPELILTVGTNNSGLFDYKFPNSYVRLSSPILFTELTKYPPMTSFVIIGSHLTYGERALYIKYGNNLKIPVRIFWFANNANQQDTDVPTESTEGVPIIRIN